jgi:3-oxoacyl-[acyl-carrier-protein] synthase-3
MADLYIHGMGHYRPENVIDNAFLEEIGIGTTSEWIVTRTGIEARRTVLPLDYIRATGNRIRAAAAKSRCSTMRRRDTGPQ